MPNVDKRAKTSIKLKDITDLYVTAIERYQNGERTISIVLKVRDSNFVDCQQKEKYGEI